MTREIGPQIAAGLSTVTRSREPQASMQEGPSAVLPDTFSAKKPCLCPGCCNVQNPLTQDGPAENFVAITGPMEIVAGDKSFSLQARGEITATQRLEVEQSLKNFHNRLGLFSEGKSHRNWLLQKVYDEQPIHLNFIKAQNFAAEMKQLGYSDAWIATATNKVSGLYCGASGELFILVDEWGAPGKAVSIASTLNHELMHALDDMAYTDPTDEANQGYLTDALHASFDAHWQGGFRRSGFFQDPFVEIQTYMAARQYIATHTIDEKAGVPVFGEYTIQKNDTLSKIAQRHKTPLAALIADNSDTITHQDRIHPGQKIKVRTGTINPEQKAWNDQFATMVHFEQNILKSFPRVYGATGYQEFGLNRESPRHEFFAVAGEAFLDSSERSYFQKQNPHFFDGLTALLSDDPLEKGIEHFRHAISQPWPNLPEKKDIPIRSLEEILGKPSAQKTHRVKSGETLSEICQKYGYKIGEVVRHNNLKNPNLIKPGQVIAFPEK